jgi:UDPglucose--hexose-1-phosphate uridylyltransferase
VDPQPPVDPDSDPFLEGHENQTPPEVYALRPEGTSADGPGWKVRVVTNLFPALVEENGQSFSDTPVAVSNEGNASAVDPLASERADAELFSTRKATGAHEIIVNGPEPVASLLGLRGDQLEQAMGVWRMRMRAHESASYVHVLVNEGKSAGASLAHTHAQLYALPFVPQPIARERERFTAYAHRTEGRNLLEDLCQEEVRLRQRVVCVDREAVAICPFASRLPFEVQIIPRTPRKAFEDDGPLASSLLADVLHRLQHALGELPPLNLWVRTAPRDAEYFCWRIDILPRLTHLAGLELGAGVSLNPLSPEQAAILLQSSGNQ